MKSLFGFGLVVLALSVAQTALAQGVCERNDSDAFRFAVSDMAIQQSGAFPLSYVQDGNVVTIEDICAELVDSSIAPSKKAGYTDVSLRFADQTCVISLELDREGKVGDFTPFSCARN